MGRVKKFRLDPDVIFIIRHYRGSGVSFERITDRLAAYFGERPNTRTVRYMHDEIMARKGLKPRRQLYIESPEI